MSQSLENRSKLLFPQINRINYSNVGNAKPRVTGNSSLLF